jgi:MtN3 and saliva related transmembrane protein
VPTLTTLAAIATVAGLINGLLPLIQIRKLVRARSAGGFSIPYLAGGLANNVIWNVYSFALGNWALILPNAVGFVMSASLLTVAVRFRPIPDDRALDAEFADLVARYGAERLSTADTLVLAPRAAAATA